MLVFTSDKERLERHFRKDPVLFAYHLADLDDPWFADCQWAVVYNETAKVEEVVLVFYGADPPALLAFGLTGQFVDLLSECLEIAPTRFICHYQKPHESMIAKGHQIISHGRHAKMKLEQLRAYAGPLVEGQARQLVSADRTRVESFYREHYPDGYFLPAMLERGHMLGYWQGDQLIGIAGLHAVSEKYGVALLGGISTHTSYRGRGIGTYLTGELCRDLQERIPLIALNVKAANSAAIRAYEKLGFVRTHEYEEAECVANSQS